MTTIAAPSKIRTAVRRWKWPVAFSLPCAVVSLAIWSLHSDSPLDSEVPKAPPPLNSGGVSPLEASLLGVNWQFDDPHCGRRFTYYHLHFEKNHIVRTLGTREIWHWWITDPRSVHIQFADDPPVYDSRRGTNLTFDAALKHFAGQSASGKLRQTGEPIDTVRRVEDKPNPFPTQPRLQMMRPTCGPGPWPVAR